MFVNAQGRPITKKRMARLVIMTADDENGPWTQLKSEAVPGWVKDPDVMGRMVNGEMVRTDGPWYLAVRVNENGDPIH